jgi:DNA-binding LacI/PurR family transcriptional regulator
LSSISNNVESLAEIARKVGLSTATISRVLNNSPRVKPKTRQIVLKAVNETRCAVRKNSPKCLTMGVSIFDFHPNLLTSLFIRDCLAGIAESSHQYGFNIHMLDLLAEKRDNESFAQLPVRLGLSALIHVALFKPIYEPIIEIAETGFPQFVMCGRIDHPQVNWIDSENLQATRKAVKYLLNLGHRRVGIIMGSQSSPDQVDRFQGYRSALEDGGIPVDKELVMERLDISPESGVSAMMELLTKANPPTAIFFTNGELAIGGIKACRKMGRAIPEDISIVSFDDSRLPEFLTPSLTYILQPVYEMGRKAGQQLATQLKHKTDAIVQELVVPDFIINESTAPARSGEGKPA